MINVINRKCAMNGCIKQASFNIIGLNNGYFCNSHKKENMVNVTNKKCEISGCMKQPTFNIPGEVTGKYCADHKESTMIDIKHKICDISECTLRASYGFLGKKTTSCAQHKQKGMITLPTRKCEIINCKQLGCFEKSGIRYCEEHMPLEAENLGISKCSLCGLDDILTNSICNICDPSIIKNRQHAKENRIRDILTAEKITFIHDKMLECQQCGRERPDFQIDCGTHFIYIEVDEHQHQSYTCECEQTRMINLVEARGIPVSFIRYNPDVYEPIKGQKKVVIEQREKKLIEYVKYIMCKSPIINGAFANVTYLFYDDYDTTKQTWHTLIKC